VALNLTQRGRGGASGESYENGQNNIREKASKSRRNCVGCARGGFGAKGQKRKGALRSFVRGGGMLPNGLGPASKERHRGKGVKTQLRRTANAG